jgi:TPR repeat protein
LLIGQQAYECGDYAKAAKEFLPLAERGNVLARFNLGVMYHDGRGVSPDDKEAVRWSRLAAEQGYADAQFNLSVMYSTGKGVAQDDKEAARWLRLAAEQGNALAQFNLGVVYRDGRGGTQDDEQAMKWLRLAAEQGYVNAQYTLGEMYLTGRADKEGNALMESLVQAHFWLSLATTGGNLNSIKAREVVVSHMTPEAITEAQRLEQEWTAKTREESALDVYKAEVAEFFRTLNQGPSNVPTKEMLGFLNRVDDLIDRGVVLGGAGEDLVKTLRDVHHALASELERAVPEVGGLQAEVNAGRELLRALGLRKWLARPK